MSRPSAVTTYLRDLAVGLPALGKLRSRVLAEAEDHLLEEIAALSEAGLPAEAAEQAALDAFGPADVVARGITQSVAQGAVRRAFMLGAALFAAVIASSDLVTTDFAHLTAPWLSDGPGTLFIWVVAQVALVAGAVSVTRAVAHTLGRPGAAQLYVVRGMLVVAACAALLLPVDALGVVTAPGELTQTHVLLVIAALGTGAAAAAATARLGQRASACLRALGLSQPETTIVGDIRGAVARLSRAVQRHVPLAAPPLRAAARRAGAVHAAARKRAPWLDDWLDSRRHPWRFAFLVLAPLAALSMGYAVVEGVLAAEGIPFWTTAAAAYPLLVAAFECALALAGYAALGPYLALRQRRS